MGLKSNLKGESCMERINCFPSKDGTCVALYVGDLPYPICERE